MDKLTPIVSIQLTKASMERKKGKKFNGKIIKVIENINTNFMEFRGGKKAPTSRLCLRKLKLLPRYLQLAVYTLGLKVASGLGICNEKKIIKLKIKIEQYHKILTLKINEKIEYLKTGANYCLQLEDILNKYVAILKDLGKSNKRHLIKVGDEGAPKDMEKVSAEMGAAEDRDAMRKTLLATPDVAALHVFNDIQLEFDFKLSQDIKSVESLLRTVSQQKMEYKGMVDWFKNPENVVEYENRVNRSKTLPSISIAINPRFKDS